MPVYEYECQGCGHHFELRQKFSDPPASACPECGAELRKLISAAAFSLKGGGWYAQGYGDSKPSADSKPSCPKSSEGGCAGCPAAAA